MFERTEVCHIGPKAFLIGRVGSQLLLASGAMPGIDWMSGASLASSDLINGEKGTVLLSPLRAQSNEPNPNTLSVSF